MPRNFPAILSWGIPFKCRDSYSVEIIVRNVIERQVKLMATMAVIEGHRRLIITRTKRPFRGMNTDQEQKLNHWKLHTTENKPPIKGIHHLLFSFSTWNNSYLEFYHRTCPSGILRLGGILEHQGGSPMKWWGENQLPQCRSSCVFDKNQVLSLDGSGRRIYYQFHSFLRFNFCD